MQDMPSESDSDDDFEGYLGPEDGPVAYRAAADLAMMEREDACSPIRRSRSLDSLTAEESALPESLMSPSHSPMQGQRLSPYECKQPLPHSSSTDKSLFSG